MSDPFKPGGPLARHLAADVLNMTRLIRTPDIDLNPAKWTYERLVQRITDYEAKLSHDDEIGFCLVSAPQMGVFHVEDIGYHGPDMLILHGTNEHGKPVQLMQHYTQLNLLLTAVPKVAEEPRRIGFDLSRRAAEDDE